MPDTARQGRQPDPTSKSGKIRELLKTGMSPVEIAKKLRCTTGLVYNVKARMGGAKKPVRAAGGRKVALIPRVDGLDSILAAVKGVEREREQLRTALERIQSLVAETLA